MKYLSIIETYQHVYSEEILITASVSIKTVTMRKI